MALRDSSYIYLPAMTLTELTLLTNPTMHLSRISQCSIQNMNVHISFWSIVGYGTGTF